MNGFRGGRAHAVRAPALSAALLKRSSSSAQGEQPWEFGEDEIRQPRQFSRPNTSLPKIVGEDMSTVALLYVVHWVHYIYSLLRSLIRTFLTKPPRDLDAHRRRVPHHLAVVFALPEGSHTPSVTDALVGSVERAVRWCQIAGIERLTVYDDRGTKRFHNHVLADAPIHEY